MAVPFSPRQYFKNIQTPQLITQLYATHGVTAVFEISETTPRSVVVDMLYDYYKSLDGSIKYDIERELALVHSLSTKFSPALFRSALQSAGKPHEVTEVECKTIHDFTLYYYLTQREVFDEVLYYHDFYTGRRYFRYEAKRVDLSEGAKSLPELTKEFERIANKHDRVTSCDVTHRVLDGRLYIHASFEGSAKVTPVLDKETSIIDRTRTSRSLEQIHIVYIPEDEEVMIAYTGGKAEKLILLDTFLRLVCGSEYQGKVESYDLKHFSKQNFTFPNASHGFALLSWKIKSLKFSFGAEKIKKRIHMALPSAQQEVGMAPLYAMLRELGLESRFSSFTIDQVALSFTFVNEEKPESSVNLRFTITPNKISLNPLFPYDRRARLFVRQVGVDLGFVEDTSKTEKEEKIEFAG